MATTGDETLADERGRRIQAGGAAIAAGVLTIGGGVLTQVVYSSLPDVHLIGVLREQLGPPSSRPGLKAHQVFWYHDHAAALILLSVVLALAAATIGLALSQLYRSVKARRPELKPAVVYAVVAGAVLVAVSGLVRAVAQATGSASYAGAAHQTAAAARDVLQSPTIVAAALMQQLGVFALGIAFVLIALNAMRVGLLTRFMGVLGIIAGVVFIVPQLGSSLPIVQAFWLCALGVLFLHRWPAGMPPAWVTGEAQPWPTQQQLRESRLESRAAAGEGGDEAPRRNPMRRARPEPPETPAPELPERRPHPSSKKKKRKRR
ncbi:MAG TPA: hypothetical protein VGF63_12925 [Solirubrobacteraceae bacterium]